ncbi:MAG: hypothetical protein WBB85_22340 [Albidovulum sp.]|uniref:hypothetical protein n=1 Tax=Albidovulum sp. TaxID=1872424 RepID=UPI003C99FBEA
MISRTITACAVALSLTTPVFAASDFSLPIDDSFGGGTLTVNGYGRGYMYKYNVIESNGQLAVCGASYFADASSAIGFRRILRKAVVELDGKKLVRDLSFFKQVRSESELNAGVSTCRNTGVPVPASRSGESYVVWPSGGIRF